MSWSDFAQSTFGELSLVRLLIQRGLAAVYFVAFLNAHNQFKVLLGERGLLPVGDYLPHVTFREAPSVFHLGYSDRRLTAVVWPGLALSVVAMTGLSERGPFWVSLAVWLALYALYLSLVSVGQQFYGFGWESMLLEAGFFGAFLGPAELEPSLVPVLALRWMLFRTELGAGLIKLRHDPCWRNLTCLDYHYETQPIPNPLSRAFHHFPRLVQRLSVAFSHFVQVVVPFGLFAPQPYASAAGVFIIVHQLLLIASGNYAWLNWLTIVLGFSAFSDGALASVVPFAHAAIGTRPLVFEVLLGLLALATLALSVQPALNLFSKRQAMNRTYNSLHLVGSYGAFGSVTRERYEIVLEGTREAEPNQARFLEYEFKGKPGDPRSYPHQWAPYHLRLDWLMWFLPLRMPFKRPGVTPTRHEVWFVRLVEKLLENDRGVLSLLRHNPFPEAPPAFVRATLYRYEFTNRAERSATGLVWKRTRVSEYLPPQSRRTTSWAP